MNAFRVPPISDRKFWSSICKTHPRMNAFLVQVEKQLDSVPQRLPMPTACDYLQARWSSNRGILDRHWRDTRPQFAGMVLNRLMQGAEGPVDERLLNWIFDFTFEPSWSVSAHLPGNDLPGAGVRQLDLAATEMAAELAEMREGLLPWMSDQTQTLADSIVHEIDRRCLIPFVNESPEWWAESSDRMINNWSGVCGGALLTACLSLEAQGFRRPEAMRRAIEVVNLFWDRAFTATGECDEGTAYWAYGVEYGCMPLTRMTAEQIARDFDVARIRQTAHFPEHVHVLNNYFYACNDTVACVDASLATVPWLAEFAESEFLSWWASQHPQSTARSVNATLRAVAALAREPQVAPKAPRPAPARYLEDQQLAIFQRQSSGQLFTFGLTGGHNGESHNHNDLGAFQVIIDDVPWVLDVGVPVYQTDFFGAHRYTKYIVASSAGHCCPAINGHEQRAGKAAAGKVLELELELGRLRLDLTSAYPREANLKAWYRGVVVPPGKEGQAEAAVRDAFTLSADGVFTHRLWFRQRPELQGQTITCGPLTVSLSASPDEVRVHAFDAQDERLLLREFPAGHTLYRVDMDYRAAANEQREVATVIRLG